MKSKKIGIPILLSFMTILLVSTAYAACTFTTPGASATITGSYFVNVSCATIGNPVNCSLTGSSSTSGDTLTAATLYNTTTWLNATIDSTLDLDANDWSFSGTCYNLTGETEAITARTGITIDNTNPTCSLTSGIAANTAYERATLDGLTITYACGNSVSATLYLGGEVYTMTESSDVCTYAVTDVVAPQVYDVYAICSDGTDTTTSSTTGNVNFQRPGGGAGSQIAAQQAQKNQSGKKTGIYILLAIGGYLLYKKKKGK